MTRVWVWPLPIIYVLASPAFADTLNFVLFSDCAESPVDLGELWEQTGYALGFGRGAGPSTAGPSTAGPSTAGTPIAGAPPVESALHTGTPLAVPPVHGAPTTGFTSSGPAENAHPVMPFLNGLQGTSFTGHVAAGSPPSEDALLAWHVMGNVPFINALYVWHSEDGAFNNSVPVGWYPIGGAPAAGFAGHGITADSPPSENALLVWHVVGNALFIDALYVWHSVDGAFNSHAPLVWYPIGDAPPVGTLLAVPPTATYLSTLPPEPAEASSPDDLEIIISSYDSQM
ncbi:hypothetical protein DL93DRAFT_2086161 [Clavulina sp. PMI_390]|nr:hypothetical protein DL93DRAFT_2086161 [Clavulina sp. PMI_390]